MSSITDPQRLVELIAHEMFRDATERDRRDRGSRLKVDEESEPRSDDPRAASPPH